jgi:hypothetical protein
MLMTNDGKTSVAAAVAEAKAAYSAGLLNDYSAMNASGAGIITATIATSGGPAMRR